MTTVVNEVVTDRGNVGRGGEMVVMIMIAIK